MRKPTPFEEKTLLGKIYTIFLIIVFISGAISAIAIYLINKKEEDNIYQIAKKKSTHIRIDEISGHDIYLIKYADTIVGTVAIKR